MLYWASFIVADLEYLIITVHESKAVSCTHQVNTELGSLWKQHNRAAWSPKARKG